MGEHFNSLEGALEKLEEDREKDKKISGGIMSGIAGLGIGVITRFIHGENAYNIPVGGFVGGMVTSLYQKAGPLGYIINLTVCETGYYAGVASADFFIRTL